MSLVDTAIALCERFKTKVFPVSDKNKPIFKWVHVEENTPPNRQPSDDPDIIKAWCTRYTALAIIAGPDLLIVDIDVKEGQNGKASLKYMVEQGLPTETYITKSPSGGLHLYYNTPAHYTPKQGANLKVLFDQQEVRDGWDETQREWGSSGVDIRHKNGYVIMADSETPKGKYVCIKDVPIADIPISMQIGRAGSVDISNAKIAQDNCTILGTPIQAGHRDEAMLAFTMDIARKNLPPDMAEVLIKERLKDCNNDDGEAPTLEDCLDKYTRAKDKVNDIIDQLILDKVYISQNQRVISVDTGYVCKFEDMRKQLENKQVTIETVNGSGETKLKRMNPADVWLTDPDRRDVLELIFDPRFDKGVIQCARHQGYTDGLYYNQFEPVDKKEKPHTVVGERIFEAVMTLFRNVLTNDDDHKWFMKWLGVSIFAPDFRPAWHWHIFGQKRGSGKTTLTKIVRALCGERNCVDLDIDSFEKAFNMELFDCYMGFMNDFTSVSGNTASAQKLNTAFKRITGTDKYIKQAKYIESAQSPIFVRFIFTSNNGRDFPVDEGDRRLYKCESKGIKLDHETLVLAHGMISENASSSIEKESLGFNITKEDVGYAQWLMYEHLRKCGYEDMRNARDCPHNESKDDYVEASKIGYINTVQKYIDHKSFIFGSDIMTEQSLQIFLDVLKIKTKVTNVIPELLEHGVIRKVPTFIKSTGKTRTHQIWLPMLQYDEETDEVVSVGGEERRYLCYVVRNFEEWILPKGIKRCKKEQMKVVGVRNLMRFRTTKPKDLKVVNFPSDIDDLLE